MFPRSWIPKYMRKILSVSGFLKDLARDCVRMSGILVVWLHSQRERVWEGAISGSFGLILDVRFRENERNPCVLATFSAWDCVRRSDIRVIWIHSQCDIPWEWPKSLCFGYILCVRLCEKERYPRHLSKFSRWDSVRMSEILVFWLHFQREIVWK